MEARRGGESEGCKPSGPGHAAVQAGHEGAVNASPASRASSRGNRPGSGGSTSAAPSSSAGRPSSGGPRGAGGHTSARWRCGGSGVQERERLRRPSFAGAAGVCGGAGHCGGAREGSRGGICQGARAGWAGACVQASTLRRGAVNASGGRVNPAAHAPGGARRLPASPCCRCCRDPCCRGPWPACAAARTSSFVIALSSGAIASSLGCQRQRAAAASA